MPKDGRASAAVEIDLPGFRRGRVVPSDDAGQYRVYVGSVVERLAEDGLVSADQAEAARYVSLLMELGGLRPNVGATFGPAVDHCPDGFGLERLGRRQLRAWRQLGKIMGVIPPACRPAIEQVCMWDQSPASVARLRIGLAAVAAVLGLDPRRAGVG